MQIAKVNGTYKGRLKNRTELAAEFLAKYLTVINYLKRKNPPIIIDIAKLTKNTVPKVKEYINK